MRYSEIVEAASAPAKEAASIWKATQKKHRAAHELQDALGRAKDASAKAKASSPGPERAKRVQNASARQQAAKQTYADTMRSADASIRSTQAK
ncbi:MAG: hypothetical protein KKG69_02005 [Alphaproteobacteria bacterium]|nr:hypothetical protein [Alphaproteobacteria bacterium]